MVRSRRLPALAASLALAVALGACNGGASPSPSTASSPGASTDTGACPAPPSGDISLTGAGATFPALLYQVWIEKFSTAYSNVQINYQSIGSGGGIKAITQGTVDFGASDAALKDEEVAALPAGSKVLHVPTALGAVVVTYNVKGTDGSALTGLQLDADNVANIFLGHIATWNDPAIAANNADIAAKLPATPILVVHRSDGSGTTNAFTTYLDTVSSEWHTAVGKGKEVKWPVGNGAPGNEGVSVGVKQTDGAVGYVELQYATISGLPSAKIKNAAGKFVAGSSEGVTAAAEAAVSTFPADFRQAPIINGPGDTTYPIAAYTYILGYVDQKDATKGQTLVSFLCWALTDGQAEEKAIGYAPLPAPIQAKALDELHQFTTGGAAIWP
jgi:phosphate transport system substrate-binding protein